MVGQFVFTPANGGDALLLEYERRIAGTVDLRGDGICRRGSAPGELILRWWDSARARETVLTGLEVDGRAILSTAGRSRLRWSLVRVSDDLLTLAIAASTDGTTWDVHRLCAYRRG